MSLTRHQNYWHNYGGTWGIRCQLRKHRSFTLVVRNHFVFCHLMRHISESLTNIVRKSSRGGGLIIGMRYYRNLASILRSRDGASPPANTGSPRARACPVLYRMCSCRCGPRVSLRAGQRLNVRMNSRYRPEPLPPGDIGMHCDVR